MKKFNKILTIAAVAATSVFGFASCNQDDYYDNEFDNDLLESRAGIHGPKTPDPFRGGVTYHFGDKVMKSIDNYGDAEWTCVSDHAPYYFIHVSNKKYSMSEKDDMHYAQSEYAATKEKLEEVGKQLLPHIVQWTPVYQCDGKETKRYLWSMYDVGDMKDKYLSKFIPVKETNVDVDVDEYEGIPISHAGDNFFVTSEEFWIANSHDYPYANIKWEILGVQVPITQKIWENPANKAVVEDSHHWSYYSPCGGHRFFFIKKVDY